MDVKIAENYIIRREVLLYKKAVDKSGRAWIYPIIANAGDQIHVSADPQENIPEYVGFRGYGGSTLRFNVEGEGIVELRGPWHSNAEALFEETGIDLRDTHITYIIIAKDRDWDDTNHCIFKDVLYQDKEPIIGDFYRGTRIAMELSKKLNIKLAVYSESTGGSSNGFVYPDQIDVHGSRKKNLK